MTQGFDNTLTDDVVWKTGKWLTAYDVAGTTLYELNHLTGQKPAFTGLVTDGYNRAGIFCQSLNMYRWMEPLTLL